MRRPSGTRNDQQYIFRHENVTLPRANFFSYVSQFRVRSLSFYKTMNQKIYCEVITSMIEELRREFKSDDFLIVHDNAKWAKSVYTTEYLKQTKLNKYFISIPPYSPDMNIIENCWAIMKRRFREEVFVREQPRTSEQMSEMIERHWQSISIEIINNLYKSLPKRMEEIIRQDGNLTKY